MADVEKIVDEIKTILSGDDFGRAFYNMLLSGYNGLKLIDFAVCPSYREV
ncbi:hypothetical protein [Clostridium aceticum]|nr:hypothetical protein [Clostridium aceticum]